jgi:hypothetical protein
MRNAMRSGVVAAALLAVPALLAAQSHIPATRVGITVAGTFSPRVGGQVGVISGDRRVVLKLQATAPFSAPTPPPGAPTNMALLVSADKGNSVSLVTSTIANSGVGVDASLRLVNAVAELSYGTAEVAVNAIRAWNAAVLNMSGPQLQALLSTPEGVAAVRMMKAAADALLRPSAQMSMQLNKSDIERKAPSVPPIPPSE